MKKILAALFALCFASLYAFAVYLKSDEGSHTSAATFQTGEKRNLSGFHSISVQSGIDLYVKQDNSFSVEVESDDDANEIITEVVNGVLKVYYESGLHFSLMRNDKVYVRLPELKSVKGSGGSDVIGEGTFKCTDLDINSSGGSDVKLSLDAGELTINCSGGADVELTGTASKAFIEVSGGSDFKGYEFQVIEAELHSSGGSDIQITVKEKLKARSSGGSDIYYRGEPEYVDVDSSGGSDVHKR